MTSKEILRADVLDILFDNRNKQYGAYALRKNYPTRLGISLGIALSSVGLLFILAPGDRATGVLDRSLRPDVVITDVEFPSVKKQDIIIPQTRTETPRVRQVSFVNPVITDDALADNVLPDQDALTDAMVSDKNVAGNDDSGINLARETPPAAVETEPVKTATAEPLIQKEPEFPGGQKAWLNFLQKHLVAPEELEAGQTKTVSIRFYVSTDGSVTGFEVLKSAGSSFDNEVIRVLRKMPKWKPAIQNSLPVSRAFTQPVTFVGVEQ